jgi:hypothetical protein
MTETGIVDRVRQPEYTGENRCLPCTVVNVAIAVSAALVVGTWGALAADPAVAAGAAGAVLVAGLAAIWLRGYLVPGTPTLTKRYFPERLLAAFGKADDEDVLVHPGERGGDPEVDVERRLLDSGALEPCRGDDYCLTGEFREAWHAEMDALDAGGWDGPLARLGVVEPGTGVELRERTRSAVAVADGGRVGLWESRPAARADLAAAGLLADRVADWDELASDDRVRLTGGLRVFLETCPDCGGRLAFDTETRESCCTSREVAAVSCVDCDARLFESPVDTDALAA